MKFEDLLAWQKARQLTNAIYRLGRTGPLRQDFSLKDQLQRAATSAMTNLAEGFERLHVAEKIQFWNIAKGSAGEVKSLLYVVLDNQLGSEKEVLAGQSLAGEVSALTQGLMNSTDRKRRDRARTSEK
jgi:four helix bundle protein